MDVLHSRVAAIDVGKKELTASHALVMERTCASSSALPMWCARRSPYAGSSDQMRSASSLTPSWFTIKSVSPAVISSPSAPSISRSAHPAHSSRRYCSFVQSG
jgi:hypothetical protein